jgi:site-specific DNA recombinase
MRERGEHAKRRGNAPDFLLSGILRCGRCGKAYIGMSANATAAATTTTPAPAGKSTDPKPATENGSRATKSTKQSSTNSSASTATKTLTSDALAKANAEAEKRRSEFEQQLASISAEITRAEQSLERYHEAFERGKLSPERCETRLQHLQARLDDLHAQEAEPSLQTPDEGTHAATAAGLADLLEDVLNEANPQKTKPLLRLLIDELRVNGRAEVLPTYRLITPTVCAMSEKVERIGIEPMTSALQRRRSPS